MSEPTAPPTTPPSTPAPQSFEISLEDIDSILDQEDPDFNKQLEAISNDKELASAQDIGSLSLSTDELLKEDIKEEKRKKFTERFPKLYKLAHPFRKVKDFVKTSLVSLRNQFLLLITKTVSFLKNDLIDLLKYSFSQLGLGLKKVFAAIGFVLATPLKTKIIVSTMIILIGAGGFLLYSAVKGKFFFLWQDNMLRDFRTLSDQNFTIKASEKWEKVYSAFPQPEYSVLIDKIVVNLVRLNVNTNPMAAFKVFLTTDAQSTAVEVKDREKEILDLFARVAEEFSYEEMVTKEGKDKFKTKLMDAANQVLNQGEVNNVNIETLILKP